MKNVFQNKMWPVIAGLLTAFVIMMVFEFVNSFFYSLPEGLDTMDNAALQAFTATLPWTAYILVFLGWVVGAFVAGYVTTYLAKEDMYRLSLVVGVALTLLGILNNMMIGHDMLFNIIALPMFIIFTYLGHRYMRHKYSVRQKALHNV